MKKRGGRSKRETVKGENTSPDHSSVSEPQTLSVDQALQLAVQHHGEGRLQEAEHIYRQMLLGNPKQPDALHLLGVLAAQTGNHEQALALISSAIEMKPDNAEMQSNLGNVLDGFGRFEEAITHYQNAIRVRPGFSEAHYNLGNALMQIGRTDEALLHFRQTIEITPLYAEAHYNLGNALLQTGRIDEAISHFRKAIDSNPRYAEAHNNLGNALLDLGQLEKAITHYCKAIDTNPDLADAHSNLGYAYRELGALDKAISHYKNALSAEPNMHQVSLNLGYALRDQGKQQEAVTAFQQSFVDRTGIQPKGAKELSPGVTAFYLELTNKCNFHCSFCPSDFQKREIGYMDIELAKSAYKDVANKKLAPKVELHLMGEPTLYPKLIEILVFAKSLNVDTELVTNGSTMVTKIVPNILKALKGTIVASHMTPTKETYRFRGEVGLSWDRYISNIQTLIHEYLKRLKNGDQVLNKIEVRIMITKDSATNASIVETSEQVLQLVKEWSDFTAITEQELGLPTFKRPQFNADSVLQKASQAIKSYQLQQGVTLTFWDAFTFANTRVSEEYDLEKMPEPVFCPHPFYDFGVLWNGDVTLCCLDYDGQLKVGNIRDDSIESVMQSEAATDLRASMLGRRPLPPICQKCQERPVLREDHTAQ
jgi:tetratricopeptide (TPR) repeat protein/MoaA/NifB/PqqE/SkfB family radical SAM enzyme